MTVLKGVIWLAVATVGLALAGQAGAQESLDQGKTPAQLFASDCAICHKSPQGLAKGGGLFGIQGFLREHYTASRESAAAIASYLDQVDRAAAAAPKRAPKKTAAKPPAKKPDGKPDAAKPDAAKSDATKSDATKSDATKPGDTKATDAKAAEPKAAPKPAETGATPPKPDAGAKPDEKKSN